MSLCDNWQFIQLNPVVAQSMIADPEATGSMEKVDLCKFCLLVSQVCSFNSSNRLWPQPLWQYTAAGLDTLRTCRKAWLCDFCHAQGAQFTPGTLVAGCRVLLARRSTQPRNKKKGSGAWQAHLRPLLQSRSQDPAGFSASAGSHCRALRGRIVHGLVRCADVHKDD